MKQIHTIHKSVNTKTQRHEKINPLYFIIFVFFFLFFGKNIQAQVSAIIDLSRNSVYVQQPFRVNITVYTKTWFTAPLEFTNLQIPNAFIVPFDKTQPGMFTVGGKQYPGVQFYYIVFPYKAGEFSIPSLEITAQSPPEGSSTARKVVIHTSIHKFIVKDIPHDKKTDTWLVAKDLSITEKWNTNLNNLKVGDVIERTVTVDAKGTLPQFIPNISEQYQIKWASVYPKDPVLDDSKTGGDVNGKSIQSITYLLEKSGDFTIPEVRLSFWNPYTGKMQERTLTEKKLHIAENPNLGILTTLRDSLQATTGALGDQNKKKETLHIFGFPWYQFAGIAIATLLMLFILVRISIYQYKKWRLSREKYKQSEKYLFKQFLKADTKHLSDSLYKWWDTLDIKPSSSIGFSLDFFNKLQESKDFKQQLAAYYHSGKINLNDFKKLIKKLREEVLSAKPEKLLNNEQEV